MLLIVCFAPGPCASQLDQWDSWQVVAHLDGGILGLTLDPVEVQSEATNLPDLTLLAVNKVEAGPDFDVACQLK